MFTIEDIINTLNQVEVRGKNNMDLLLGAIMALEAMLQGMNNQAKEEADAKAKEIAEKAEKEGEVE